MNKKLTVFFAVIIAAAMLFGACQAEDVSDTATPGPVVDNDANIVVVEVNGEPIYYDEYYDLYAAYCSSYGIAEDDEQYASIIQEMVLSNLVSETVLTQKLEELGYMDLSDEELAEATQQAQDEIDYNIEYLYGTEIDEVLGEDYTDEERAAVLAEYEEELLDTYGLVKEDIIQSYIESVASEAANEDLTKDIVPTEEEIKAEYDDYVAADEEALEADTTLYVSYFLGGSPVYYVPTGVRQVLQVLVGIDEDTQNAISLLRSEGYDDQADLLREDALAKIEEEAQALLDQIEAGELSFEDAALSEEYNDDTGTTEEGYPVVEGATDYVDEFTEGAMALEEVGDMSGLVGSDFGYHILKYIADTPEGAVDYDSVHDDIAETLTSTMQSQEWSDLLDQWETEAEIVYYDENL